MGGEFMLVFEDWGGTYDERVEGLDIEYKEGLRG